MTPNLYVVGHDMSTRSVGTRNGASTIATGPSLARRCGRLGRRWLVKPVSGEFDSRRLRHKKGVTMYIGGLVGVILLILLILLLTGNL